MPIRRKRRGIPLAGSADKAGGVSAVLRRASRRTKNKTSDKSVGIATIDNPGFMMDLLSGNHAINEFRNDGSLHVSDLLSKCMRMYALAHRFDIQLLGETLWDNVAVTFAIGRAIGDYMVQKASRVAPAVMYGKWSCACNTNTITGTAEQAIEQGACSKCGTHMRNYDEYQFYHKDTDLIGSVDLTLLWDTYFYLTEVKSIKKEDWEELVRPLPQHILQVVFYWWLAVQAKEPVYDQVSIVYVTKGQPRGTPFKEFVLKPADHLHRLDDYIEDAKALVAAKKGGPLPVRICDSPEATMAKTCQTCNICFEVD